MDAWTQAGKKGVRRKGNEAQRAMAAEPKLLYFASGIVTEGFVPV
jgi:hypothetical protein